MAEAELILQLAASSSRGGKGRARGGRVSVSDRPPLTPEQEAQKAREYNMGSKAAKSKILAATGTRAGRALSKVPVSEGELLMASQALVDNGVSRAAHQGIVKTIKQTLPALHSKELQICIVPRELQDSPYVLEVKHVREQLGGGLSGTLQDRQLEPSPFDPAAPAHRGFVRFPPGIQIINPIFMRQVIGILKVICMTCSCLLVPETELAAVRALPAGARLATLKELTDKGEKMSCPNALTGQPHPPVKYKSKKSMAEGVIYYEVQTKGARKPKGAPATELQAMSVNKVISIFRGISEETAITLGFSRQSINDMIINGVYVPPLECRPLKDYKGRNKPQLEEISKGFLNILRANQDLKDALRNNEQGNVDEKTRALYRAVEMLEEWILKLMSGKRGLGRNDAAGKRTNFSARAVIIPGDELSEVNWIGVPEYLVDKLGRVETATPGNVAMLRELLRLGQVLKVQNYNGRRAGEVIVTVTPEMVANGTVSINVGDKVFRRLMHGDWILDVRAPVIHRHGMAAHRVYMVKSNAFKLNLADTAPKNADFDGDEINVKGLHSDLALEEAEKYLSLEANLMSSQSGLPITGLVQNGPLYAYLLTRDLPAVDEAILKEAAQDSGLESSILASLKARAGRVGVRYPSRQALFSLGLPDNLDYLSDSFEIRQGVLVRGCYTDDDLQPEAEFVTGLRSHYASEVVEDIVKRCQTLLQQWGVFRPTVLEPRHFAMALGQLRRPVDLEDFNRRLQALEVGALSRQAFLSLIFEAGVNYQQDGLHIVDGILVAGSLKVLPPGLMVYLSQELGYDNDRLADMQADLNYLRKTYQQLKPNSVRVPRTVFEECASLLTSRNQLLSFNERVRASGIPFFSGKSLFSLMLPADFEYRTGKGVEIVNGILVKGAITSSDVGPGGLLIHRIINDGMADGTGLRRAAQFLTDANRILNHWGRTNLHSVGYDSVAVVHDPHIVSLKQQIYAELEEAALDPGLSDQQIQILGETVKKMGPLVATYEKHRRLKEGLPPNALHVLVKEYGSGSKGSPTNINAVHTMGGILTNTKGLMPREMTGSQRILSSFRPGETTMAARGFVPESFGSGLSPNSAFLSAMSGRENLITNVADIGELHRKAGLALNRVVVANDMIMDAGTRIVYQFGPYGGDGFDTARTIKIGGVALPLDLEAAARRVNALGGWVVDVELAEEYQDEEEDDEDAFDLEVELPYKRDFQVETNERIFTGKDGVKYKIVYPRPEERETVPATVAPLRVTAGLELAANLEVGAEPERVGAVLPTPLEGDVVMLDI